MKLLMNKILFVVSSALLASYSLALNPGCINGSFDDGGQEFVLSNACNNPISAAELSQQYFLVTHPSLFGSQEPDLVYYLNADPGTNSYFIIVFTNVGYDYFNFANTSLNANEKKFFIYNTRLDGFDVPAINAKLLVYPNIAAN